jgi:hypothetical protein
VLGPQVRVPLLREPSEQLALHREEQAAGAHAEIRVGALAFATSHASSLSIGAVITAHLSHQIR